MKAKLCLLVLSLIFFVNNAFAQTYPIVDTGQSTFYDTAGVISPPSVGDPFYGQDGSYNGLQPAYQDNGDGTVTDLNTGLMWQQTPDLDDIYTWQEALAGADTFLLAGYDDWRLPSIKELYSLIDFRGSSMQLIPYIDTTYFDFVWGDVIPGGRLIDSQYWSSTEYVGTTMGGDQTTFGVNFADGRIKGYPNGNSGGPTKECFIRYVRGNEEYGINNFVDNGDGTITDLATGLMWQKADDGNVRNWPQALQYAENLELAGYSDWRLPNAKELQSIVDYTRAPDALDPSQQSAAIDPIFDISEEESWFYTGTSLLEAPPEMGGPGGEGVYLAFGQAFGYFVTPFNDTLYTNVHGAGAQRGDPKVGDPAMWPYGFGPQGDEIRIYNYVRCVRGDGTVGLNEDKDDLFRTHTHCIDLRHHPEPFNPATTIDFDLPEAANVNLSIYDTSGRLVTELIDGFLIEGSHFATFDASTLSSGVYITKLTAGDMTAASKIILIK